MKHGKRKRGPVTDTGRLKNGADEAGRCELHQKILFLSRTLARSAGKRYKGKHLNAFPCEERPDLFHLGKLPPIVSRGFVEREDVVSLPRTA